MEELKSKMEALEKKVGELERTVKMIKRIFLWTIIISVALFILPLIGLVFVIPQFLSNYASLPQ